MNAVQNHARLRLEEGKLSLGIGIRQARTVDIAEIARLCGFDWLFIDMEHNSMDVDTAAQISAAALATGITPLVRVPGHDQHHATRLLDSGAMGVVFPHVNTPEQATLVARACRFPPAGNRSVPGGLPQLRFASFPIKQVIEEINRETLVVAMLETPQAIDNAEAIAAVNGIDVVLVGGSDLSAEMGIPGDFGNPRLANAIGRVVEACQRYGKHPGVGGMYDHGIMQRYVEMGARFILSGSDLAFLIAGAKARTGFLRSLETGVAA
ncbi:MAG: aldolase [Acetobacteraceae bacterium]|nr:aldolase [Acetobacteraceae bacterium]